jgi:hypothetical protein
VPDPDHVVFSTIRQRFECEVCGAYAQASFPCSVQLITKLGNQFVQDHRRCAAERRAEAERPVAAAGGGVDG